MFGPRGHRRALAVLGRSSPQPIGAIGSHNRGGIGLVKFEVWPTRPLGESRAQMRTPVLQRLAGIHCSRPSDLEEKSRSGSSFTFHPLTVGTDWSTLFPGPPAGCPGGKTLFLCLLLTANFKTSVTLFFQKKLTPKIHVPCHKEAGPRSVVARPLGGNYGIESENAFRPLRGLACHSCAASGPVQT